MNNILISKKMQNFTVLFLLFISTTVLYGNKLTLGVFPYFDAIKIASLHLPLKNYLAKSTDNEIRLISAPNFKIFKERTKKGHYDILVTAPHLGRNAELIAGYEWLGFTSNTSHTVFVSKVDSNIKSIKDIKGKLLSLPPKSAIIHHLALETLSFHDIYPNKNMSTSIQKSHNNAILSVSLNKSDVAAVGAPTWARYNFEEKNKLRMIGKSEDIPGFSIMVHSSVSPRIKKDLKEALFLFEKTTEGKSYFNNTGLNGIRAKDEKDIELLDKYLALIKNKK